MIVQPAPEPVAGVLPGIGSLDLGGAPAETSPAWEWIGSDPATVFSYRSLTHRLTGAGTGATLLTD